MQSTSLEKLYNRAFEPRMILAYFKGWEFYEPYSRYIDGSEERNVIWFEEHTYCINGKRFPMPATLGQFIQDCRNVPIELYWSPTTSLIWSRAIADTLIAN